MNRVLIILSAVLATAGVAARLPLENFSGDGAAAGPGPSRAVTVDLTFTQPLFTGQVEFRQAPAPVETIAASETTNPDLLGIYRIGGTAQAMLARADRSTEVVQAGGEFDSWRVVAIEDSAVRLERNDETLQLDLFTAED